MNKNLTAATILITFIAFTIFVYCKKSYTPVLNIIDPVTIQIDINNNGVIDDNETVCITDTEAFKLDIKGQSPEFSKELGLTKNEIISLGYMSDNYAKGVLISKPVKLKLNGEKASHCRFGDIYVNGTRNYADLLVSTGFGAKKGEYNKKSLQENLEAAKKLNLVIYNIKSGKYHKLDCEYGLMSSDYSVVEKKRLPKDASPCKYCHVIKENKKNPNDIPKNCPKPQKIANTTFTEGELKIILTDFTQKLKPDRNCDTKACLALLEEINKSKETIDIAVYGMDMIPKIYSALEAAKLRNVRIRMVYDKAMLPEKNYYKETENILKLTAESNNDYVKDKPTYTNRLMHNKFFIFDNKTVYTGSANISIAGLSDYNANTVIITYSPEIAKLYSAEFEQMLSGKFHELKSKPELENTFALNGTKIGIYFSPYDKASEKIIPIIDSAREYIYIPTFLITHGGITDALIRAKRRNVDIKIILDANNVTTRNTKHTILRQNGIMLKTENYAGKLHSKSMIIDDKYIIAGSMNFSNSGENKNDENLLIIENERVAKEYKNYFIYLWSKIPDKYLTTNAKAEGKESIGSCYDGVDNDFDGLTDGEDSGCR